MFRLTRRLFLFGTAALSVLPAGARSSIWQTISDQARALDQCHALLVQRNGTTILVGSLPRSFHWTCRASQVGLEVDRCGFDGGRDRSGRDPVTRCYIGRTCTPLDTARHRRAGGRNYHRASGNDAGRAGTDIGYELWRMGQQRELGQRCTQPTFRGRAGQPDALFDGFVPRSRCGAVGNFRGKPVIARTRATRPATGNRHPGMDTRSAGALSRRQ